MLKNLVIGTVFVFMTGCSSDSPDEIIFPEKNVSFSVHVQPLMTRSCNSLNCHGDNGQTKLTSWVGVRALNVVNQPGDTNCNLINVVYGRHFHVPVNVNDNHREGLKQWVLEGAQNN